jgi:hypothetical protein
MAIEIFFNKSVTAIICVCLKKLAKTVLMDKWCLLKKCCRAYCAFVW